MVGFGRCVLFEKVDAFVNGGVADRIRISLMGPLALADLGRPNPDAQSLCGITTMADGSV